MKNPRDDSREINARWDLVKFIFQRYWGVILLSSLLAFAIILFVLQGFIAEPSWEEIVKFSNLTLQVSLVMIPLVVSIGVVYLQSSYGVYVRVMLQEDFIKRVKYITILLLILVFFVNFITPPKKFSDDYYFILLGHYVSPFVILMAVWLLLVSLVILVYMFSLIKEMFSISPSYVAYVFYRNRSTLSEDFKKCSAEECSPFTWLNVFFNLVNIALLEEQRIPGETSRVSREIIRLFNYFEYKNPQWWKLHHFREVDNSLKAFFSYSIRKYIIIPLKQTREIDPILAYSLGGLFMGLSKILANNYLYLYPSFTYFLEDLRELSQIEPYYVDVEFETISKALDHLVEFKEECICGNSKDKECVRKLKEIYSRLPTELGTTWTSIPDVIMRAVELRDKVDTDKYTSLINKVFKVLVKYPQLLIPLTNSQVESIPLNIEQTVELTRSFIKLVLPKLEKDETISNKLPDGRFYFSSESLAMKEILLLLFNRLTSIGYEVSLENSTLRVLFKGRENVTPYPFELPQGFEIKIEKEIQKKFIEDVLSELNRGEH